MIKFNKNSTGLISRNRNAGQTLIETVVAIFMLVMGTSATVGLAVYAFGASTSVTKQIIGTGLAREGVEAVKNMRDTNWLQDTLATSCYDFSNPGVSDGKCYTAWQDKLYCLDPRNNTTQACSGLQGSQASKKYSLSFDSNSQNFWILTQQFNCTNQCKYGLLFDPNYTTDGTTQGFYTPGSGITCTNNNGSGGLTISDYCRKIILTDITSPAQYNQNTGPLLEVQSQVWWVDKRCPRSYDWPGLGKCSVEIDSYLTNWKDY